MPGARPIVLAQDKDVIPQLEAAPELIATLGTRVPYDASGYKIITLAVSSFQPDRLLYDRIAVKLGDSHRKQGAHHGSALTFAAPICCGWSAADLRMNRLIIKAAATKTNANGKALRSELSSAPRSAAMSCAGKSEECG